MDAIQRFGEYAAAFEKFYENDDASELEPYFTEDAVYEIVGGAPLAGRHDGREAIFAYLRSSLDGFDRRFDERRLDLLSGPELRDGSVWMRWRVTYELAGAPDLVLEGEETAHFDGDRIRLLVDRMPDDTSTMLAYFEEHADKLAPTRA